MSESGAVQIVQFKHNKKAELNESAIKQIIQSRGIEEIPTVVVSIGGVARSGKSFLLNIFVNYLVYLEKNETDDGWETSNSAVQGIQWAQSRAAVTMGIWMWNTPYIVRRDDGSQVAVLLVDSQGTGDNKSSDAKLDTLIMYISLQLSSFQLINIKDYLTSNELTSLELCTDYAEVGGSDESAGGESQLASSRYLFESLVFVVRNCQDANQYGEDQAYFNDIKKEVINEGLKNSVVGIEKAFHNITTFTFPYPGREIAVASEKQKVWTLQDIPEEFLKPAKELCRVMFRSNRQSLQELHTGSQQMQMFKLLKFRLESGEFPEIGTPADALQDAILYRAYKKAELLYTDNLAEIKKNLLSQKTDMDLRESIQSIQDLALQVFHAEGHQAKYGNSPIWRKYAERFTSEFESDLTGLVVLYGQKKKMEELEEQNQEVKRKMEEQAKENARQIGKLEGESKQTLTRLEEANKKSEDREKAHQHQLDKINEQMKNAREEDRAFYEREAERYQEGINREKEERAMSERMHNEKLSDLNNIMEKMMREREEQERETKAQMERLQRELQQERNRPPPYIDDDDDDCIIL